MNEFDDLYQKTLKDYIWLANVYNSAKEYIKSSALRPIKKDLQILNEWQNYYLVQSYEENVYKEEVLDLADLKFNEYMNSNSCDSESSFDNESCICVKNDESKLFYKVLRAVVLRMVEKNNYGYSNEEIFDKAVLVTYELLGKFVSAYPSCERTFDYLKKNGFLSCDGVVLPKADSYIDNVRRIINR